MSVYDNPGFWWVIGLAVTISAASAAIKRARSPGEFLQMGWLDWCGHAAILGAITIMVSWPLGWKPLTLAGCLLLLPLYPIAILGILGRLCEAASEISRAIRKR